MYSKFFFNKYYNENRPELNNIAYPKNMIDNGDNKIQNIMFINDRGIKVNVQIHSNCTIYQLIKKYVAIMGLSEYDLRKDHLRFVYDAQTIEPFSNELIGKNFGDGSKITVTETKSLIGSINNIKIEYSFCFFYTNDSQN